MPDRKPALGKGLSALIPDVPDVLTMAPAPFEVEIDLLEPNDYQPRAGIADEHLNELALSIKAMGMIQPIVARRIAGGRFQILAGERRWRAAGRAGLGTVPVVIKDVDSDDKQRRLELALVENLQRADLNPIEEAQAYHKLVTEFRLTQDQVAAQVGKDRTSIANTLRLLRLPDEVRSEVASGRLSMGHARAIVSLTGEADQRRLAREVLARNLSVRETEALAKKESSATSVSARPQVQKDVHTRAAEEQLHLALGTPVAIKRRGKRGVIEIAFTNEDELQRLYEYLTDRK